MRGKRLSDTIAQRKERTAAKAAKRQRDALVAITTP